MNEVWVLESGIPEEHGSYIIGVFSSEEKALHKVDQIINKYTEEDKNECGEFEKTDLYSDGMFLQNKCEFFVVRRFNIDLEEKNTMNA